MGNCLLLGWQTLNLLESFLMVWDILQQCNSSFWLCFPMCHHPHSHVDTASNTSSLTPFPLALSHNSSEELNMNSLPNSRVYIIKMVPPHLETSSWPFFQRVAILFDWLEDRVGAASTNSVETFPFLLLPNFLFFFAGLSPAVDDLEKMTIIRNWSS